MSFYDESLPPLKFSLKPKISLKFDEKEKVFIVEGKSEKIKYDENSENECTVVTIEKNYFF